MTTQPVSSTTRKRPRLTPSAKVNLIEVLDVGHEETTSVRPDAVHWRREFYIPLRHGELRHRLSRDERLTLDERQRFLQFCHILAATFHYEYHQRVESLKSEYEPFDPDAGQGERKSAEVEPKRDVSKLFEQLTELLRRANYHKLSQSQIEQAVEAASDWGVRLNVDFNVFERLEVYARGDVIGRRTRHHWRNMYRAEEVEVPIYMRLVVMFQLREHKKVQKHLDPDSVYIKLFKNIPKEDVDMMLPGVKAKLSLVDSGKILFPTLSGLAMAMYKIFWVGVALAAAGVAGIVGILVFVGGISLYAVRSIFGYMNTHSKYELSLTRSLYFQNLDNSSGVLLRLTDEAEHQEFHETVLAYFLLWQEADAAGFTPDELDRAAEAYLGKLCGFGIDFEVDDAIAKLKRLGLAVETDGRWRAVGLNDAIQSLDRTWDDFFGRRGSSASTR